MAEGVDFSGDRPSGVCLWSMGKTFAGRYFGPGGSWKHATPQEVGALIASGLSVFALAEGAANDALQGYQLGRSHAISANNATAAAGMPGDRPIYFNVDFDMTTAQRSPVAAYFDGAASIVGIDRVGLYGGYRTVSWAATEGIATWFMQTSSWSQGKWSTANHIEQYSHGVKVCGASVDLNRSMKVDFGQWPHPTESFGSVPDQSPPVVTSGPWDYTDVIDGQAGDFAGLAGSISQFARDLDGLRNA